jgi:hypothetical protein
MIAIAGVLAQVEVDPSTDGMPGADLIQQLLNWGRCSRCGAASLRCSSERRCTASLARAAATAERAAARRSRSEAWSARSSPVSRRLRSTCCSRRRADDAPGHSSVAPDGDPRRTWCSSLVTGVVIVRFAQRPTPTRAEATPLWSPARRVRPLPRMPGPAGEAAGVPVGFGDDEPGAVAAALAYSTASQRWLYFTDEEIEAAIAEIATPVAAPRWPRTSLRRDDGS